MKKMLIAFVCLWSLLASAALAQDLYVGEGGYESLTAVLAAAEDGDVITVQAGLYDAGKESYPIRIEKSVTVRGEDGARFEGPAFTCMFKIDIPDVTMENLTFDLRRYGIQATGDRLAVRNCVFRLAEEKYRVSSCGLWLAGAYDCELTDCAFEGCGPAFAGLPLSESSKGKVVLTGMYECGDDPRLFSSHRLSGITVNGKPFYHIVNEKDYTVPEDAGGLLAVNCENLTVRNIDVSRSSMGLQIMHSRDVHMEGVRADECGIFGTYLAFAEGGEMRACTAFKTNHAFDHRGCKGFVVTECTVLNCDQGIFFSCCDACVAERNTLTDSGFACFIAAAPGGNIVRDNVFADNATGLYMQNVENTLFTGNTFTGSSVTAVRLLNASGRGEGNVFTDNNVGVLAAPAHEFAIVGNAFAGNVCADIYMENAVGGVVADNRFADDPAATVQLVGDQNDVTVSIFPK